MKLDNGVACISYQVRSAHMLLLYSVSMIYLFMKIKANLLNIFTGFVRQYLLVADLGGTVKILSYSYTLK